MGYTAYYTHVPHSAGYSVRRAHTCHTTICMVRAHGTVHGTHIIWSNVCITIAMGIMRVYVMLEILFFPLSVFTSVAVSYSANPPNKCTVPLMVWSAV